MVHISVTHLEKPELSGAFLLVRMTEPACDCRRWLDHCDELVRLGGGVLGAFGDDGRLLGIATYRPDRNLRFGKLLRVETIVALELSPSGPVRKALCEAIELLCHAYEANAMTLAMPGRGYGDVASPKTREWMRLGLGLDTVEFGKAVHIAN